jgi:acetyl esterase
VAITDPVTRQFLDVLASTPGPALHELPVADARVMARGMRAMFPDTFDGPPCLKEDRVIPGPAGDLSIHIVRPVGQAGPLPVVMFFHGGGWVLCDLSTHERLVCEIAAGVGAAVVFVDYSLSPEARFPAAIEEAWAATSYIYENGASLNLDSARLAVAGDSVGGNMAAVVCMLAKLRGGPPISSQALLFPVTDATFDTPSYSEFADGYFLTRDAMKWFWNNYLPEAAARLHPHASPLRASLEDLAGLPPAFIMTCECDVLRDEGEAYARKLMSAGVEVTAARYVGAIHSCLTLGALASTPATRSAIASLNDRLRQSLQPVYRAHGA